MYRRKNDVRKKTLSQYKCDCITESDAAQN